FKLGRLGHWKKWDNLLIDTIRLLDLNIYSLPDCLLVMVAFGRSVGPVGMASI
ncbi:unnamed protein product, partial [Ilex paraguariensis]